MNSDNVFFDLQFIKQVVTTFIAVALGIPAGILLDKIRRISERKKEKAQFKTALKDALEQNMRLLSNIKTELAQEQNESPLPTHQLDVSILRELTLKSTRYLNPQELSN